MRTKRNLGYKDVTTKDGQTERFYLIQGEHTKESIENRDRRFEKSFYDLYQNPSVIKKSIYNDWENFFNSLGIYDIKCQGSCMTFSITAYDHTNGYIYYITKSYNRLYIPRAV